MRTRLVLSLLSIVAAALAPAGQASPAPTLETVLDRAGAYVVEYQREFAGVVAQETYTQDSRLGRRFDKFGLPRDYGARHRELKSDLLLVRPEGASRWVQFRDVFEVDGRTVRDRTDRLAKLFLQPSSSTAKQVQKIAAESARYNLGTVVRNVNVPVLALMVLLAENQPRFLFNHVEAADSARADDAWAVDYREVAPGTMIRTSGERDLPMRGRFRIDPNGGRVLASTLTAEDRDLSATIEVTYEREPALGLLVPREMHERYDQHADGAGVEGLATYSNFRRFQVKVDEKIAPIK
jgi:hypothetical protein